MKKLFWINIELFESNEKKKSETDYQTGGNNPKRGNHFFFNYFVNPTNNNFWSMLISFYTNYEYEKESVL